jgi:HJR/Mrr/RecB family endonuclease
METHFFKIDTWEFIKGVFGVAFQFMWLILKLIWPFLLVLILLALLKTLILNWIDKWRSKKRFKANQKWHSDRDLLRWLRGMTPSEFEDYISDLFSKLGYKTEVVGGTYDEGIDVIAEKKRNKTLYSVQEIYYSRSWR